MVRHQSSRAGILVAGLAGLGILAGCSGNTYGTGVTAEKQLLNDVTGLFSLGAPGRKKTRIDYGSRPKLVKAPVDGSLPAPAEKDNSQDAYFPQDPEADRQARLKEIDAANSDPSNLGAKRAAPGSYDPQTAPKPKHVQHYDHDLSADEYRALSINGQKERRARLAEINGTIKTGQQRKYLTQPPQEYTVPAETAEVGKVGEVEKTRTKKAKKGNFLDGIFGG